MQNICRNFFLLRLLFILQKQNFRTNIIFMRKISLLILSLIVSGVSFAQYTATTSQPDFFGNTTTTYRDQYGRVIGTSTTSQPDFFGNTTTTHQDRYGHTTGTSTTGQTDFFGNTTTTYHSSWGR